MQIVNFMTSDPVTIHPHDNLSRAKSIMDAGHFRRVPVVEDGRLVGILTERDLHKYSGFLESTRVNAAMRTADLLRAFLIVVAGTSQIMNL